MIARYSGDEDLGDSWTDYGLLEYHSKDTPSWHN